jgi:hypothetical protein
MASFSALSVVAQTVAALLSEAALRDEFPSADYPVIGPPTLTTTGSPDPATLPGTGVTVFPYRVTYNTQRRATLPRTNTAGERFRASLLLDLHLLITAWAPGAVQQLRLLGWAARTLEDTPMLTPGLLNRWGPGGEEVFGAAEAVELVAEPLTLQDLVSIWELNKARQQPSLGYIARMIQIDSDVRLPDAGLVRSRNFDQGVLKE